MPYCKTRFSMSATMTATTTQFRKAIWMFRETIEVVNDTILTLLIDGKTFLELLVDNGQVSSATCNFPGRIKVAQICIPYT